MYFSIGVYVRDYGRHGCELIKNVEKSENAMGNQKDLLKNGTIRTCNSFWRPQVYETKHTLNILFYCI